MRRVRSSRDVIRLLEAAGWTLVRVKGDHHHFKHDTNPSIITVPHPKRDLSIGVLKSIERLSGLKLI
jgi:predicted RNA binding protein YcfA (HicA-like mRNA interferase family)